MLLGALVDDHEGLVKVKVKVKVRVEDWFSYLLDCFAVGKREVVQKQSCAKAWTTKNTCVVRCNVDVETVLNCEWPFIYHIKP